MSGHAHWLRSGAISAQFAAVRVGLCGRRWVKLGALSAPGRERGGERSRVWALWAGYVVLVETRSGQTLLKLEFWCLRFVFTALGEFDSLRAGKNAETFVNFKSRLWMRSGWKLACVWTWLRYISTGIWSCAASTQNSDTLFWQLLSPSCLFYLLLSDLILRYGSF